MIRGRARAINSLRAAFEPRVNAAGGGHAFGDRVHYFFAAVDAIAGGEIFGVAGLIAITDGDGAVFADVNSLHRARESRYRLLADGADDHVYLELKFAAGDDCDLLRFLPDRSRGRFGAGANTFDCRDFAGAVAREF